MWPPIKNSRELHVLRSNHQAKIWLQADQEEMHVSSPISTMAWEKECGYLRAIWTKLPPFSAGCLQLVTCGCESKSKTARCTRFTKKASVHFCLRVWCHRLFKSNWWLVSILFSSPYHSWTKRLLSKVVLDNPFFHIHLLNDSQFNYL